MNATQATAAPANRRDCAFCFGLTPAAARETISSPSAVKQNSRGSKKYTPTSEILCGQLPGAGGIAPKLEWTSSVHLYRNEALNVLRSASAAPPMLVSTCAGRA